MSGCWEWRAPSLGWLWPASYVASAGLAKASACWPVSRPAQRQRGAGNTPIGSAFAALHAAATTGGALLTESAGALVVATVAEWDGTDPPLAGGWLDEPLETLPVSDRPGASLALLAALAPYRITDRDANAWRKTYPTDAELVRLLAFGAISAVSRGKASATGFEVTR